MNDGGGVKTRNKYMNKNQFMVLRQRIIDAGYGEEIVWQESLKPCEDAQVFCWEYIWVVINAGMKNQIARQIFDKVRVALFGGKSASSVFHHEGKAKAIDKMWATYQKEFVWYQQADDKIAHLKSLPWIGDITKYHLAKNLGFDVAKPDRHLERISKQYNTTPLNLCEKLSKETGYRIATVDLIIWRAANLGMI